MVGRKHCGVKIEKTIGGETMMSSGIIYRRKDGYQRVVHAPRYNELISQEEANENLIQKLDRYLAEDYEPSLVSWFELQPQRYDRDRWQCQRRDIGGGYKYQLDLESMFSPSFERLLDYIEPHMLTPARGRDGYIVGWERKRKPPHSDLQFRAYNMRLGDDGIGGFRSNILFSIAIKEDYENEPSGYLYVMCHYDAYGSDDRWSHNDNFPAHRVLTSLLEDLNMGGWIQYGEC
jgi:hypothetical protein